MFNRSILIPIIFLLLGTPQAAPADLNWTDWDLLTMVHILPLDMNYAAVRSVQPSPYLDSQSAHLASSTSRTDYNVVYDSEHDSATLLIHCSHRVQRRTSMDTIYSKNSSGFYLQPISDLYVTFDASYAYVFTSNWIDAYFNFSVGDQSAQEPFGLIEASTGASSFQSPPQDVLRLHAEVLLPAGSRYLLLCRLNLDANSHANPMGTPSTGEGDVTIQIRPAPRSPGDMNCDGSVSLADLPHFVDALLNPRYAETHPTCSRWNADYNQDGHMDGADIGPFVAALIAN